MEKDKTKKLVFSALAAATALIIFIVEAQLPPLAPRQTNMATPQTRRPMIIDVSSEQ